MSSKYKIGIQMQTRVEEHVEARHITLGGAICPICLTMCPNKKSLRRGQAL